MGRNVAADERRRQERRELILGEAQRVFASRGAACSLESVAERLGISKATIYLYFPKKNDLLFAVAERAFEAHLGRFRAVAAEDMEPEQRLSKLMKTGVHFVDEQRLLLRLLMEAPVPLRTSLQRRWARPARAAYQAVIKEGQRRGHFRKLDAEVIAHCAFAIARSSQFYEGSLSMEAFAEQAAGFLCQSVRREPARRKSTRSSTRRH